MSSIIGLVASFWWIVPLVLAVAAYRFVLRAFGVLLIPQDSIGIVTKRFVLLGANRTLPDGHIVALNGEAGTQADTLAPGVHFFLWPWQYTIALVKFTRIPEGMLGVVESSDGAPISGGRVLGRAVSSDSFQNARAFLTQGGERGPQLSIIPPGVYRINTALFQVSGAKATVVEDNMVGVVTTQEGAPLPTGEIAGREIPGHNSFQNGQAFVDQGGTKGLQVQVILAGRYFINPRFAAVEMKPMTDVPIAHAGVVIAYVGEPGKDVTGDSFKHGNLVSKGQKGVWVEPLDPGKYPLNPYAFKVENVPTANVVLNWATGKTEAHKLDEKLSTITVRSSDGFTFNLDVSQIIHIPRTDAPKVIARFGSVANLVTQVLEPTIGNYFRNAAQGSDIIEFLKNRKVRQVEAKAAIESGLHEYDVGAVDTLIGDIVPPEALMKTLTDRKIAEQETTTYETQRLAQEQRQKLEQATAQANTQAKVVDAERTVQIKKFEADAAINAAQGAARAKALTAEGDAQAKTINADADAKVRFVVAEAEARAIVLTGEAEGKKTMAIGTADASVIRLKTAAVGQQNYAIIETSKALATSKVPLVPQIASSGGSDGASGGSLLNILLANLLLAKTPLPVAPRAE